MRFPIAALLAGVLTAGLLAAPAFAQNKPTDKPAEKAAPKASAAAAQLQSQSDKLSYSIGLSVGRNLKHQDIDVDPDKFALGLRDALKGDEPALSDEEMRNVMFAYQMERRAKAQQEHDKQAAANKKAAEEFMATNKTKKGVKTTASGLQYKVLKEGNGAKPTAESTVTANYKGMLIDGTEFDSSYSRGQPAEFPLNGVIPGWSEALQLMKVGAKYQIWIPSDLAYGDEGRPPRIGPNEVLVFEIELLKVQ